METTKLKKPELKKQLRHMNTKYLERLQKIMDAANTRTSSLQPRKKFIEHQNRMNYRNEFDRLRGALSHLKNDDLIRAEIQKMVGAMGIEKLKEIGEYEEEKEPVPKPSTAPTTVNQHLHMHRHEAPPAAAQRSKSSPPRRPRGGPPTVTRGSGSVNLG